MFRARVLARTLSYVFFVTSTCFCLFFSNYLEDYVYTCTVPYCTRTVHCGVIRDFRKKKCTRTCTLYMYVYNVVQYVYCTRTCSVRKYESTSILLIAIFMEVSYGSKSCTCTFEDIPHYGYRSKQDKQLRTARDSENFHAGAAAQILLFMEPDTACDFHVAPAPCARETHTGLRNPIVGLLTACEDYP